MEFERSYLRIRRERVNDKANFPIDEHLTHA